MEYLAAFGLTLLLFWFIIVINNKQYKKQFDKIKYRQSDIHNNTRFLIPKNNKKKLSQLDKHMSDNVIKIIVVDNKAYWVVDNMFYTADINNGEVVSETTKQVNTLEMSKDDIDKMLFILDNLGRGNDDNSSSRNDRF